jgi:Tfp pilus assembly protein PilF
LKTPPGLTPFLMAGLCLLPGLPRAQTPPASGPADSVLLTVEGKVEISAAAPLRWTPAEAGAALRVGDRLRTGLRSRATIRLHNATTLRVNELTTIQIQPPGGAQAAPTLNQQSGSTYFFSREKAAETRFRTPLASGAIRGTEFHIEVGNDGRSVVTLIDGRLELSNPQGELALHSGEQATVDPGQPPRKTAVIEAVNIIQWCLYYPAVLDPDELALAAAEREALRDSLRAYREGDLLRAVALYPDDRQPASDAERIYLAALTLSAGQVRQAEELLRTVSDDSPLAVALRRMVAAVKFQSHTGNPSPALATEWLAESYYRQSRSDLPGALDAARNAAEKSPAFGFARARVAELEFSFGRTDKAQEALSMSLLLAPRHAQALTLYGFTHAAQNRIASALSYFDQAIAVDGALGNAWLGRGLCRIRKGDRRGGLDDLQTAATVEPNRAVLRSYLGKAFNEVRDTRLALRELALAQQLDPNDPTAWLYSALVKQEANRVNDAVRDLEKSRALNDNRRIFRSRLLLDQDRAVRSANLASVFRNNGMIDLSTREAARAVNYDYANYSAHLFLANSYDALRDPNQTNLRYETPWLSELLVANLLAPVGASTLSQYISQQEYSKLFERDRLGVSSSTDYNSNGEWLQRASQFGQSGHVSYALDSEYRFLNGTRANNQLDQLTLSARFKAQATPHDTLYAEAVYYDAEFGDVAQYYNNDGSLTNSTAPSRTFRGRENQEPNVFLGWRHEWAPGVHTLLLASRLDDRLELRDPAAAILFARRVGTNLTSIRSLPFDLTEQRDLEAFSIEAQQLAQTPRHTFIGGARYQVGEVETRTDINRRFQFPPDVATQDLEADLQRVAVYSYWNWRVWDPLLLTAGVSYDRLYYPDNLDIAPVTRGQRTTDQLSPKAGLIYEVWKNTHLRAVYTRSLGGVFFDQSVRLEPVQVAGFNQAFRSLVPESVVGLVPGTRFETFGLGFDTALASGTYLGLEAEVLWSDAGRTVGVFTNSTFLPVPDSPSSLRQQLDFRERSVTVTLNQLIARDWSVGARYRLSEADLNARFPGVPATATGAASVQRDESSVLHQVQLYTIYQAACGFFAQFDALWHSQSNRGYTPALPGDDFWQFNVYAGYRFLQRRAEALVGVLNLTDRDYRLNPLNLHSDLPRQRAFAASFKFYF